MTSSDDFADITRRFEGGSLLIGAFAVEEQRWQTAVQRGEPGAEEINSSDVVARAWARLTPDEQAAEMEVLFNGFYHSTLAVRKELALADMEPDANTYLLDGDLSVIDDTLSGAMALSDEPLDSTFPDGMVPVDIDLLQRLISELELLRHRLAMRSAKQSAGDD